PSALRAASRRACSASARWRVVVSRLHNRSCGAWHECNFKAISESASPTTSLQVVNVGLNLIYLVPGETGGMETYARELIPALVRERPDLKITSFINREAHEGGPGPWDDLGRVVVVPVRARRCVVWVRGERLILPRVANHAGLD